MPGLRHKRLMALTPSVLLALAVYAAVDLSGGTPLGRLLRTLTELSFVFVTLSAPGYALLMRFRGHRLQTNDIALLAIPVTLTFYLAAFVVLYVTSAPQFVYQLIYLSCLTLALAEIVRMRAMGTPLSIPRAYLMAALLAFCAVCFICTGIHGSPWKTMDWHIPAGRATHMLAEDNLLQWATAQVFIHEREPWAWNDGYWNWSMGDRPALLGALTAVYAKSFLSYRALRYFDYTLLGIVLNALYVIPAAHLAHRLLRNERKALLAVLALALVPYFFVNVYYTWPKLAGVFFTFTALAFLLDRPSDDPWAWPSVRAGATLGGLLSLGAMCHGGAALSAPCIVVLVILFARWRSPVRHARACAALVFGFALVAAPWALYVAMHPSIQTNNMAYHYRPSLERPGHVMDWSRWFAEFPLDRQVSIRWNQLLDLAHKSEFRATFEAYARGELNSFYAARWVKEFWQPISQLDELRITLGLSSMAALAGVFVWKRWSSRGAGQRRGGGSGKDLLLRLSLLGLPTLSYVANVLLKWQEVVPHALPIAEIACISLTLALCVFSVARWLGYVLLWSVLARFLYFSLIHTVAPHHELFGIFGVGLSTGLGLLLWTAIAAVDEDDPPNASRLVASWTIRRTRLAPPALQGVQIGTNARGDGLLVGVTRHCGVPARKTLDTPGPRVTFLGAMATSTPRLPAGVGYVEHASNVRIKGWARGPNAEPVALQVIVDGVPVARILANAPRPDVGPHGFEHNFDPVLVFRPDLSVRVVVDGGGQEVPRLGNRPLTCELPRRDPIRRLQLPLFDSPFLHEIAAREQFSAERLAFMEAFAQTGLARIRLEPEFFESVRPRILDELAERYAGQPRLMDAWRYSDAARELACSQQIMDALAQLYGRVPIPMQTLNFVVGTEQSTHSDTVHFNSMPSGFMCGAWVALEPITLRNGPLHYYPGSQRLPILDLDDIGLVASSDVWSQNYEYHQDVLRELIRVKGYEKVVIEAEPGDVIIWAANLLHGGEPILEHGSTRHSQVTHYYFEGCSYYTPMRSNVPMGEFHRPDRRDIRTGERLQHYFDQIALPYRESAD